MLISVAAVGGLVSSRGSLRRTLLLGVYFLLFWGIFIVFYAGSYYYGADVRYLAALARAAGAARRRRAGAPRRPAVTMGGATGGIRRGGGRPAAAVLVVRAGGPGGRRRSLGGARRCEIRQTVRAAAAANAIVLTHNPSLFHVWGINAAQLSLARTDPAYVRGQMFDRYAGGVYLHWSFWCNVDDPVQTRFCHEALAGFPSEQLASARERTYEYRLYRLARPQSP